MSRFKIIEFSRITHHQRANVAGRLVGELWVMGAQLMFFKKLIWKLFPTKRVKKRKTQDIL